VSPSDRVVIGMDPHKRSATIEVMTGDETVLGTGRFDTDRGGYAAMAKYAKQWPNRVWAIEGRQGIGRHIATGCSPMVSRWSTSRRSCPPEHARCHRPGSQDRRHRCPFRRNGRHADGRAASAGQR
jgi:hypothetical protein